MKRRSHNRPPLWLALRFPHLSLEAIGYNYQSPTPVIVSQKRRVYHCNALALAEGITRDMSLSTAQALLSAVVSERDLEQEQQALRQLAETCYQFTPYIEFHHQGLLLEVSRSLTLFHGLESLLQRLSSRLQEFPHHYCLGLAHTSKAAWLLSWQHFPISEEDNPQAFRQRLRQVPVDHLTEFPDTVIALQRSGFQTLGDLVTQMQAGKKSGSSAAIRQRFGAAFTDYLEDLLGNDEPGTQGQLFVRPPGIFEPDDGFQEYLQFDYPIDSSEQLREPMQQLLEKLVDKLIVTQQQCHSIQWRLYDIHQNRQELVISSERIHSHWQLPLDLTMIQLEHTALSFEVDSLELVCQNTSPVNIGDRQLLDQLAGSQNLGEDSERLFARLIARLGKSSLSKLSYRDHLLPENCQDSIAITDTSQMQLPPQQLNAPRPSWLFDPPQIIQKKQQQLFWHGPLQLLQGPERLQGHWWNTPSARDYFMAQRSDYLRCWIYQDLKSQEWYVHGVFA
jgi:protein ImuB